MKQLIYTSRAREHINFSEIQEVLTSAKNNNRNRSITGMLVYDKSRFLQCIEGSEDIIDTLYEKIIRDSRHYNIQLLGTKPIETRSFEDWNLGYINDSSTIKKVIEEACGLKNFEPQNFDFSQARDILLRLSFLI